MQILHTLPPLLAEIPDAPKRLYIKGTLPPFDVPWLAVVGARKYTPYGKQVCEKLLTGLRGSGVVIVSGLALGIDGIAHEAALAADLTTVAVPGSGLDKSVLYPRSHLRLAERIVTAGGALISEFEPTWRPRPESFPQRNRIMAGLSNAILVIEAAQHSGTLITARLGMDYNRDVLALPGPIHQPTMVGTHQLIKDGAALISSSDDILAVLGSTPSQQQRALPKELSDRERRVVEALCTPAPRDKLLRALQMDTTSFNVLISSMELKGLIKEEFGELHLTW